MAMYDLNILPLHKENSAPQATLRGLHAAAPPRGASRSRKTDQLILLLKFNPPAFSDERLEELMARLTDMYYQKNGSTTSAMRELIQDLNNLILNLNLRHAANRPQVLGSIGVIVLRGEHFFLAQSGLGHMFAMIPGKVDYLHDENASGRGLGTNSNPQIYYAQMPVTTGDKLLFSIQLPEGWDAGSFEYAYTHSFHETHRRFLQDAGEETLEGLFVEITEGKGEVALLRAPAPTTAHGSPQTEAVPTPVLAAQPPAAQPTPIEENAEQEEIEAPTAERPRRRRSERRTQRPTPTPQPEARRAEEPVVDSDPYEDELAEEAAFQAERQQVRKMTAAASEGTLKAMKWLQNAGQSILTGLKKVMQRIIPGDELLKIPTSYMAFIAIAVPLIVVTIGALVYAQVGRNQQYQRYLTQAESVIEMAASESNVAIQHQHYQTALDLIATAEGYVETPEIEVLRQQVQKSIDSLDNVQRLDFQPALANTLASSVQIREMVSTSRDLYMLDINSDSVMRAWLSGTRYQMDSDFRCGAGPYGSLIVDDLIDIALLPENPDGAVLVAVDKGGNLLYCYEDSPPVAVSLIPPDSNWGKIKAITVENERLYVLDEQINMVWYYNADDENFQFRDAPFFFFVEQVPNMQDVIDLAIDREELYLLYLDGHTTTCTFSAMDAAPTTCVEPAEYNDTRTGRESGRTIEGAVFYQIQHTQPPEPSLFYLDPVNRAIYHFSLKLNLVELFQPQIDLEEGPISAFTVNPTRAIFIAQENKVYMAFLP